MDITKRQEDILKAMIQIYYQTGEPVGSRTISKYPNLKFSSATIRNDMSDLEEMGFIEQPHTSAGRIPSDKGYRFYVERLLEDKYQILSEQKHTQKVTDIPSIMVARERMDEMLLKLTTALAEDTEYAVLMTAPQYSGSRIRFIQLSDMNEGQLLIVIVLEGNIVRNRIINLSNSLSGEVLLSLNLLFNTVLNGTRLGDISLDTVASMKIQAGEYSYLVGDIIDGIIDAISKAEGSKVYTAGITNIFKYEELSQRKTASDLIRMLEDEKYLLELLDNLALEGSNRKLHIYIGEENSLEIMHGTTMIIANFSLGNDEVGRIGIIGPKRMDYEHILERLHAVSNQLDMIFSYQFSS